MPQTPKRLPGERNPEGNPAAANDAARDGWMADGHGSGDFGIGAALNALLDWRQRRKARKARDRH